MRHTSSAVLALALAACAGDPDVEISASPLSGELPLEVELTAVTDDDVSLAWDFGDGFVGDGAQVTHTFVASGRYEVEVTATDARDHSTTVSVAVEVAPASCPTFLDGESTGRVAATSLVEASGLVASRSWEDVWWSHNDSGAGAEIHALDGSGADLGIVELDGATNVDWEDIAIGPGPTLYVGDIGDNLEVRSSIAVWMVPEPEPGAGSAIATELRLEYPDEAHNAEAIMVDSQTGDLFVVTKSPFGSSQVFRKQAPLADGTLEQVATLYFGQGALLGNRLVTAGDISVHGDLVMLATYDHAFVWLRDGGEVGDVFDQLPCQIPRAGEPQGEAIAFDAAGRDYRTVSEGVEQPMWLYVRE